MVSQLIKATVFNGVIGPATARALKGVLARLMAEPPGIIPEIECSTARPPSAQLRREVQASKEL